MTMQQVGLDGYRQLISRDIDLAQKLQEKIRGRDDFELVATGPLSVTCFLYKPADGAGIEAINCKLIPLVQTEGEVFLTGTELEGRFALRACVVNFRTGEADLDLLLDVIADAGKRVE
jgi:glutamate/tyrosine decarboxylase-like PLP-dependent enzyme